MNPSMGLLYGALLAISLFNIVVLLWLGLTVLLNARRRSWGVGLGAAGLLAGALFFISHTAFMVRTASGDPRALTTWWPLGWVALIFAPFAWYLGILWYTGYWEERTSSLRRRHRPLLVSASLLALAQVVTVGMSAPLRSRTYLSALYFVTEPAAFGIPPLVLIYPVFAFLCISSSYGALRRPGAAVLSFQQPALVRAQPWLRAATLALLAVSVMMLSLLVSLLIYARQGSLRAVLEQPLLEAYLLDLVISVPITAAVVLTGQAIVAHEVFTRRPLPRRGLRRQWKEAIGLAMSFGLAAGAGYAVGLHLIYIVLVATILVGLTLAFFGWRSHREQSWLMRRLRPFIASEHVFEALLEPGGERRGEGNEPLASLCRDVLGARSAWLAATGSLSSLIERPLSYPEGLGGCPDVQEVLSRCPTAEVIGVALDPARWKGAVWGVPLWSSRGQIGVLLLGEKEDGGLYAEEEVEIARATGERLLNTLAGANLARRVMSLQRQRLMEAQVLDQQSRRCLHDEVLPELHAAMLALSAGPGEEKTLKEVVAELGEVHKRISSLVRAMPSGAGPRAAAGLVAALRELVQAEYSGHFEKVRWEVDPGAEEECARLPGWKSDVLFYAAREAIRNSARHGRGGDASRALHLRVEVLRRDGVEIRIGDDGIGAAEGKPDLESRQGLALHSTMLAVIGGSLTMEMKAGVGTAVILSLPQQAWGDVSGSGWPRSPEGG
jgi:signal transduction histidine kinase